jgi:hypothetical protein
LLDQMGSGGSSTTNSVRVWRSLSQGAQSRMHSLDSVRYPLPFDRLQFVSYPYHSFAHPS